MKTHSLSCHSRCITTVLAQRAVPPARSHHPDIPYQSPTSLGAASYAKVLCSGGVRVRP